MRWVHRVIIALLIGVLLLQGWFFAWVAYWRWHNPSMTAFMRHDIARLERSVGNAPPGGHALRPPRALQQHWVEYSRISANLKRAVVTSEDGRFLQHGGVDWQALEKAYDNNQSSRHHLHGGSTITQQLAKNLFLSARRSYVRKFQELLITYMIEAVWDKKRILEVYLNVVEWGDGVYGAEAAARHYYGLPAAALSAEQAARLAAMIPNPKYFDQHRDVPFLAQRTESILRYLPDAQIP
jgi:monofunctional biosynthetic peptidoglycan transglycosylase